MAAKGAPLDQERRDLDTRLAEAKSLPNAALTKKTAQKNRVWDKLDPLSSVKSTLSVEVKKAR